MTAARQGPARGVGSSSLPALVRGYVERVLPTGSLSGRTVRLEQIGEMVLKPGAKPRRFRAREEFAIDRVAFAWRAHFPIVGPLGLRVTDTYDGRDGLLEVGLAGLPLQRKRGAEIAEGEAFRYLAEIAWAPPAMIANGQLAWRALDARTVEVATDAGDKRIAVRVTFNERGEIEQTAAERPRAEAPGGLTPWIGAYGDYQQLGGMRVPTRAEVRWDLDEGPFTYWRGQVTALELRA